MLHFTHDRTYTACGRPIGDAIRNPKVSWTAIRQNVDCKNCLRQLREIPAARTPKKAKDVWDGGGPIEIENASTYRLRSTHDSEYYFISVYDCENEIAVGQLAIHITRDVKPSQDVILNAKRTALGTFEVTMTQRRHQ